MFIKKKFKIWISIMLIGTLLIGNNTYSMTAYGQEIVVRTIGDLVNVLQQNGQVFELYQKAIPVQTHTSGNSPDYVPEPIRYITASESETADMILFDDEIAYWYSLSNHNKNVKTANSVTVKTSGISHDEHCEDKSDVEANVNINVQDLTDYSIFANILKPGLLENMSQWISQTIGKNSKETILDKFNHWFIGHKDIVKDKVTLYPGKNSPLIKNELTSLIGAVEAFKPVSYKQGEGEDVLGILRNIFIDMNYDYSCGGCGAEGQVNIVDNENMNTQNSGLYTIQYQYGKAGLSELEPDKKSGLEEHNVFDKTFSTNAYRNIFDTKDKFLQFYPYIRMRYTTEKNRPMQDVFITSTNRSKMRENLVVNVFTEPTTNDTIDLEGDWTTQNSALHTLSAKGIENANTKILAGGANLSLKTKGTVIDKVADTNTKANNILVESFVTCVPDEIEKAFYSKTYTESEALIELDKFKKNIVNTLNKYSLEKWVAKGIYKNQDDFIQKADCVQGNNEVKEFDGNTLNKDISKYYLSTKDTNKVKNAYVNSKVEHEQVDVYMVQVNTYGDLLFYKNRVYQGCIYKSKFKLKWTDTLLKDIGENSEWFILNANTRVIDNLIGCLDKDLGKSGRFGGYEGWYNEAIDGISIVRQELDINLYLENEKFDIQDPALCGALDSAYDLWSSDENKWRTCQYRLSNKGKGTEIHEIGTLCGTKIYIPETESLLKSKLFYLGNGTVEDH